MTAAAAAACAAVTPADRVDLRGIGTQSSGITYGLAIGVGGLAATALGALADATSITVILTLLALFALTSLGLAASLPGLEPESRPGELTPRARVTL